MATGTSSSLTYDLNGNLTSDGTNSYSWDAENRLIEIVYPGSGNNSQFAYDPLGRNVQILEYSASSLTSTKQFVWCRNDRCEARNSGSTITAQYFGYGETISGTSYFYAKDHLGSVREMTNSSGTIEAQYAYDPYGQVTKISESVAADFGYAGYYLHARSGLNLTRTRAYSSLQGRFINRDPIMEKGGVNVFANVSNNPISFTDPSGETENLNTPPGPFMGGQASLESLLQAAPGLGGQKCVNDYFECRSGNRKNAGPHETNVCKIFCIDDFLACLREHGIESQVWLRAQVLDKQDEIINKMMGGGESNKTWLEVVKSGIVEE